MSINKKWFILLLLLLIDLPKVTAYPSGNTTPPTFTFDQGFGYDSWGITRNSADGFRGYIAFLALETLGENKEFAYATGERFRNSYSNDIALADAILAYVQRWTEYGYDKNNVYMNRVAQEEWAWNADEMAHVFNENKGITAIGECEDVAFLCLTIYYAAFFLQNRLGSERACEKRVENQHSGHNRAENLVLKDYRRALARRQCCVACRRAPLPDPSFAPGRFPDIAGRPARPGRHRQAQLHPKILSRQF